MNRSLAEKEDRKDDDAGRFNWILELAIFAVVTPALIYGVLSLNNLPVV